MHVQFVFHRTIPFPTWHERKTSKMAALLWDIPGDEDIQESREPEELSVFGYACKLFRNDHKAISIDREEHLIPWMGDSSLLIDRSVLKKTAALELEGLDLARISRDATR